MTLKSTKPIIMIVLGGGDSRCCLRAATIPSELPWSVPQGRRSQSQYRRKARSRRLELSATT